MSNPNVKIKVLKPHKTLPVEEIVNEMIREYYDLKKLKEIEETKRLAIEKATKVLLRKLDIIEKGGLEVIEKDYRLKESAIKLISKKFESSDDPNIIMVCVDAILKILRDNSLEKELESITKLISNNQEIII